MRKEASAVSHLCPRLFLLPFAFLLLPFAFRLRRLAFLLLPSRFGSPFRRALVYTWLACLHCLNLKLSGTARETKDA